MALSVAANATTASATTLYDYEFSSGTNCPQWWLPYGEDEDGIAVGLIPKGTNCRSL